MRISGLFLLIVGAVILGFGWQASQTVSEQVVKGVTGTFTEPTMLYLIGGISMVVGGLLTILTRFKRV